MIDIGASRHLTGYKEALFDLIEKNTDLEIILGDNAIYPMKGTGTVTLHLSQGQVLYLQDVLYISDLKKNLVSILEILCHTWFLCSGVLTLIQSVDEEKGKNINDQN